MLSFRKATIDDAELYYEWVNEEEVRKQSFHSERVDFESHLKWFQSKIKDEECLMFLFQDGTEYVGQVRIDIENGIGLIDYSIEKSMRGKGYASLMLRELHEKLDTDIKLIGFVKVENYASRKAFLKAGFLKDEYNCMVNGVECCRFCK